MVKKLKDYPSIPSTPPPSDKKDKQIKNLEDELEHERKYLWVNLNIRICFFCLLRVVKIAYAFFLRRNNYNRRYESARRFINVFYS